MTLFMREPSSVVIDESVRSATMAPVEDVSVAVTPELNLDEDTTILLIKLDEKYRLAGSIFSEITELSLGRILFSIRHNTINEWYMPSSELSIHESLFPLAPR